MILKKKYPLSLLFFYFFSIVISSSKAQDAENTALTITSEQSTIYIYDWLVTADTLPGDSLISVPDSLWFNIRQQPDLNKYIEGNWLLKQEVYIKDSIEIVYGFFPWALTSSYAIYWDGIELGRNGTPGTNKSEEVPGLFDYYIAVLPQLITPGKHTLTLRLSNFHNSSGYAWYKGSITVGPYGKTIEDNYREKVISFVIGGILVIPFLFNLFLFFNRRGKFEHLLFGLICFLMICDLLAGNIPIFFDMKTTYVSTMNLQYKIIAITLSILFPAFFVLLFSLPKKNYLIPVIILVQIIAFLYSSRNIYMILSTSILILSTLIIIWAALGKKEGSTLIFVGLCFAWIGYFFDFPFIGLTLIMVICTSFLIAKQFALHEKAEREAKLRSTRLENELLKKNINPHFLMNSLTSIIAWLRKDPPEAIKFIEALAQEFKMVMHISSLEKIRVQQEIELCKTHLKIMSFRKSAEFKLQVFNLIEEEQIPPMIFHTLVENGITHGYVNKFKGLFSIRRMELGNDIQFIITNDGELTDNLENNSYGIGLQYVKTRLEESYPGKWNLQSRSKKGNWEVIISIERNSFNSN